MMLLELAVYLSIALFVLFGCWLLTRREGGPVVLGAYFLFTATIQSYNSAARVWSSVNPDVVGGLLALLLIPVTAYLHLTFGSRNPSSRGRKRTVVGVAFATAAVVALLAFVIPCAWDCPRALPWAKPWLQYGWVEPVTVLLTAFKVYTAWFLIQRGSEALGTKGAYVGALICADILRTCGIIVGAYLNGGYDALILYVEDGASFVLCLASLPLLWKVAGPHGCVRTLLRRAALLSLCLAGFSAGYARNLGERAPTVIFVLSLPLLAAYIVLVKGDDSNPAGSSTEEAAA